MPNYILDKAMTQTDPVPGQAGTHFESPLSEIEREVAALLGMWERGETGGTADVMARRLCRLFQRRYSGKAANIERPTDVEVG